MGEGNGHLRLIFLPKGNGFSLSRSIVLDFESTRMSSKTTPGDKQKTINETTLHSL